MKRRLDAAARAYSRVPVVMLHGWGGSYESTWASTPLPKRLRALGRTVIGLDLPDEHADLTSFVARQLPDDGPVDLVGHSLGARLALAVALREPARVRRLVICGLGANAFRPDISAPVFTPAEVNTLRCPAMLVSGERDKVAHAASELMDALPSSPHLILPRADHQSLPAHPELAEVAAAFLRQD